MKRGPTVKGTTRWSRSIQAVQPLGCGALAHHKPAARIVGDGSDLPACRNGLVDGVPSSFAGIAHRKQVSARDLLGVVLAKGAPAGAIARRGLHVPLEAGSSHTRRRTRPRSPTVRTAQGIDREAADSAALSGLGHVRQVPMRRVMVLPKPRSCVREVVGPIHVG